jgi:hypothetical protein
MGASKPSQPVEQSADCVMHVNPVLVNRGDAVKGVGRDWAGRATPSASETIAARLISSSSRQDE